MAMWHVVTRRKVRCMGNAQAQAQPCFAVAVGKDKIWVVDLEARLPLKQQRTECLGTSQAYARASRTAHRKLY